MEGMGVSGFWQDRSVLVTGATGLVGGWLTQGLVAAGADVVCLVRDWVPQSELVRTGTLERVKVVRGDIRDREVLERAMGEYETGTVIHLAAQTIVGIASFAGPLLGGIAADSWGVRFPFLAAAGLTCLATAFQCKVTANNRKN